jgi:hypothetical protein
MGQIPTSPPAEALGFTLTNGVRTTASIRARATLIVFGITSLPKIGARNTSTDTLIRIRAKAANSAGFRVGGVIISHRSEC